MNLLCLAQERRGKEDRRETRNEGYNRSADMGMRTISCGEGKKMQAS